MIKDNVFSIWTPITDLSKADADEQIKIGGICSSENEDQAGEIILQSGLDFTYFLKRGYFNLEHMAGPGNVLGNPTSVKPVKTKEGRPATYVEGILYATKSKARDVIDTIKAMQKAKADRKIGFSIEGSVIARDKKNPKIITKAKVMNVSITSAPCNTDAEFEMIKKNIAFIAEQDDKELEKAENLDLPMTYRHAKLLEDYSMKMCELLKDLPEDTDLPEWVQSKITKAVDYIQSSYHYLEYDLKMKEMDKAMIDYEDDESPESKAKKLLEKHPELKDPEIMAAIHAMLKATDFSPIQRESLEGQIASADYMMDEKLLRQILKLLIKAYPDYSDEELLDFMEEMAKAYYKKEKKEDKKK